MQSTADYPAVPFILGLERGSDFEEAVLCTAKTATEFTVTRGYDGTPARAHALDARVEHCPAAIDFDESNAHIFGTTRDDHPQYYNAARFAAERTEVWTGTALPTAGNFAGRVVFATALTNSLFRNRTYVYRTAWGLLHPARFHNDVLAADINGNANTYYDLIVLDLGAMPCAVNIRAEATLRAYPKTNAGTLWHYIRDAANGQLCWTVKSSAAWDVMTIHIFRRIAYASGASVYYKTTTYSDQAFLAAKSNCRINAEVH